MQNKIELLRNMYMIFLSIGLICFIDGIVLPLAIGGSLIGSGIYFIFHGILGISSEISSTYVGLWIISWWIWLGIAVILNRVANRQEKNFLSSKEGSTFREPKKDSSVVSLTQHNFNISNLLNIKALILPIFIIAIGAVASSMLYDVGIWSSYHSKRDFKQIFTKRMTGDCEAFAQGILIDAEKWKQRCVSERDHLEKDMLPIVGWEIHQVSINGDQAFLQVELMRDRSSLELELALDGHKLPEKGYFVNYQMKRLDGTWYINQPFKD